MAAGSYYNQKGGGSEYLCLPDQPEFLGVTAGHQDHRAKVYGAEYETSRGGSRIFKWGALFLGEVSAHLRAENFA